MATIGREGDLELEVSEMRRSRRSSSFHHSSFQSSSDVESTREKEDAEVELQWAVIERLRTYDRVRTSLFDSGNNGVEVKTVTDVTKLGALERRLFIDKLIKDIEKDNRALLTKLKERIGMVGVKLPTVEVRFKSLCVDAKVKVVHGNPLPTLWNSFKSNFSVSCLLQCPIRTFSKVLIVIFAVMVQVISSCL